MGHSSSSTQSASAFKYLHGKICHVVICHPLHQDFDFQTLQDCKFHATFKIQLPILRATPVLSNYPMGKIRVQFEDPLDSRPSCQPMQPLKALLISFP